MKFIKICLVVGSLLVSGLTHGSDDLRTKMLKVNQMLKKDLIFVKLNTPMPVYDYDNNAPPSFEKMTSQVGKQSEIQVFLSDQSILNLHYFMSSHPDAVEHRKTYYSGVLSGKNQIPIKVDPKIGMVDMKLIKKMDFYENGVMLTIDVENSPYTEFTVDDLSTNISVVYTFGHGYVLKAELQTIFKGKNDPDDEKMNYLIGAYKQAVKNKDYSYNSLWGYINDEATYVKGDSIVNISQYKIDSRYAYLSEIDDNSANMAFYTKETYNNYDNLVEKIKQLDKQKKYQKLDKILQN